MTSNAELEKIREKFDTDISTGQDSAIDLSGIIGRLNFDEKTTTIIISPSQRYKTFKVRIYKKTKP